MAMAARPRRGVAEYYDFLIQFVLYHCLPGTCNNY